MQSMLDWNALGYELAGTARNGKEALDKIAELHPDIVVSDIRMPVMDGLTLAARCREKDAVLPAFIMLTSYEEFDYVRRSMSFVEFVTETRIAAAKTLMATTDLKIYEISERLGFESAYYFSKVFKKLEGVSPRDYMKRLRGGAEGDKGETSDVD